AKLGLAEFQSDTDEELVKELLSMLQLAETDMTIFYRQLATIDCEQDPSSTGLSPRERMAPLMEAYYVADQLTDEVCETTANWLDRYHNRVRQDNTTNANRREQMNRVNPKYVLRNYLAQMAIDRSEQGDHGLISELLDVLRNPYDEQPDKQEFAKRRPDWARHRPGCSMLSCSS
ncbi:MAG: hypothetical protein HKN47_11705, partial [Pirellulaceae bacterium]|nr:hypothetical protein [Pirellulaceae bacterium]